MGPDGYREGRAAVSIPSLKELKLKLQFGFFIWPLFGITEITEIAEII